MIKSIVLVPFSLIYGAITKIRNYLYESGTFKSAGLNVPVISIGNITVGGTGKTPLVAYVTEILAGAGEKVCILTRGYKRENESERVLVSDGEKILANVRQAGDEPFELAEKLLGKALVIADADRRAAGEWARENFGITAFVLDDAFQHLKVKRELDIVCVDATNPFGNGKVLPSGILREPLKNLSRADAIVITRANLVENISALKSQISKLAPSAKVFVTRNKLRDVEQVIKDKKGIAFGALGNPENFFAQLRQEGFDLALTKALPDHYFYTPDDIEELEREATARGADYLLTTAKDGVKLASLEFNIPLIIAKGEIVFDDDLAFRDFILSSTRSKKSV